jgi:hypothetical protein
MLFGSTRRGSWLAITWNSCIYRSASKGAVILSFKRQILHRTAETIILDTHAASYTPSTTSPCRSVVFTNGPCRVPSNVDPCDDMTVPG